MRLIELSLLGVDLTELRQFYCAVLGLREIEPAWTGRLAVQCGGTQLYFRKADPGWHGRYHFAFDIPAFRFEAALAWLLERRAPMANLRGETRFHSQSWNADSVYFTDPQGNILELIARYNKTSSDAAGAQSGAGRSFNVHEIISISEIGFCTEDVAGSVASLQTRMPGIAVYSGEDSDQFTAVGSHDGLLIVVRRGRIWYPESGVPADLLPLEILLEVEAGRRYRLKAPPNPFVVRLDQ